MDDGASTALDPELAALLRDGPLADLPEWHEMGVAEARRVEDEVFSSGSGPAMERVTDRRADGPAGDVPVRVYHPPSVAGESDARAPALVFYHGGGWVLGTLDSADDICRELAARVGAVVVSVDYRLAPEHPFPAPVDDAVAALSWTREHAPSMGVDPDRLAVAGTSAGGGLAAAVALRVRDRNRAGELEWSPAGQVLCYPMLDPSCDTDSHREHADAPLLSTADSAWFWEQYLPDGRGGASATDPSAAPPRADTVAGVPPAVVATAGHDVLRSEGVAYAERLDAAVAVRHLHSPRLAHGFLSLTDEVDRADAAMDDLANAVRHLLADEDG